MTPSPGKTLFINQLGEGQRISDLFLVQAVTRADTKAGKPYLAVTLMDRSGEIACRVWDDVDRLGGELLQGAFVRVQAQAQKFRDQLQLKIDDAVRLADNDPAIEPGDFMPASARSPETMEAELRALIQGVKGRPLRNLLVAVFDDQELGPLFRRAPAAKKMHHAHLGGLLEHSLSVAGLALKMAEHYPRVDRDLLVAGALLHDLGKVREFSFEAPPFDYTDAGRLLGHILLGLEMVRSRAARIKTLAPERLDALSHLIASHHGRHEFGAPVIPMTVEGFILHAIDDLDSKVDYIERLSSQVEGDASQWSEFQRPLERFLFLRGRQEAPAPETERADEDDDQPRQPRLF